MIKIRNLLGFPSSPYDFRKGVLNSARGLATLQSGIPFNITDYFCNAPQYISPSSSASAFFYPSVSTGTEKFH